MKIIKKHSRKTEKCFVKTETETEICFSIYIRTHVISSSNGSNEPLDFSRTEIVKEN